MTLNDLLHCPVLDAQGARVGHVIDVRLRTAGPDRAVQNLAFDSIIVSRHRTGSLLGYERRREQRPAVLAWLFRRHYRDAAVISWTDVASWEPGGRVVLVAAAHLAPAIDAR